MSETFPRFNLPELNFLEVDAQKIQTAIISSYETIAGRKLASGDPIRLFLLTLADVIIQQRQAFNLAARQNLLSYATGDYLDHLGRFVNTERLQAAGAKATIRFTLNTAQDSVYIIPRGTRVSNSQLVFATDETAQIPQGSLQVDVVGTCEQTGSSGNGIAPGDLNILNDPLPFIDSVANIDTSAGGADIESDAAYAERIRLAPASFSVAGPHDAYVYHALRASALITDVSVYGLPDMPGDVYVHPLLSGGELPNEAMLQEVRDCLNDETVRPLTDRVIVSAPEAIPYSIDVTWFLADEDLDRAAQITAAVEGAVEEYRIWQQSAIGRDINPDRLIELMRLAGAKRMEVASPVFTSVSRSQVAQCDPSQVKLTYAGIEEA